MLDRLARHPDVAKRFTPGSDQVSAAFVNEALRLRPPVHALVRPLKAPLHVAGWVCLPAPY